MRRSMVLLMVLLMSAPAFSQERTLPADVFRLNTGPCLLRSGSGSPENAVVGSPCDHYVRTDQAEFWEKKTGTGTTTGWQRAGFVGTMASTDLTDTANLARLDASNTFSASPQRIVASDATQIGWLARNTGGGLFLGVTTAGAPVLGLLTGAGSWRGTWATGSASTEEITFPGAVTNTYAAGWAGTGYRFDYGLTYANQSFLELDRLSVRGNMSVYELLVHQVRATNGSIFVANTGKAKTVTDNGGGSYTILTETDHGFAVNDLIRAQRFTGSGTWQSDLTVTAVADTTTFTATLRATYAVPAPGMEFVRLGNATTAARQSSIYLTADDANAPYINILSGVDSFAAWGSAASTRGRIGNLNGSYEYVTDIYGMGFGDSSAAWLTSDPTLGVRVGHGATTIIEIAPGATTTAITLGPAGASGYAPNFAFQFANPSLSSAAFGLSAWASGGSKSLLLHSDASDTTGGSQGSGAVDLLAAGRVSDLWKPYAGLVLGSSSVSYAGRATLSVGDNGTESPGVKASIFLNYVDSGTITLTSGGATTINGASFATSTGAITWSGDTNLYRSAANTLKTDDALIALSFTGSGAGLTGLVWSGIDKTGSSLADLVTRSAGELSSGTLDDARLSSNVFLKNVALGTTTSADYPVVWSSGNSLHYYKTDGYNSGVSGAFVTSLTAELGIVTDVGTTAFGESTTTDCSGGCTFTNGLLTGHAPNRAVPFQARLDRLERENAALWAELAALRALLTQHKENR